MVVSLAGYMGSGKSHISKNLSKKTGLKLVDLDREIACECGMSILDIFKMRGELYFRREERRILQRILDSGHSCILSLGGGTPAYYDNMELINAGSISFYLRANVRTLAERLQRQKSRRPLIANIADQDLPEFIAKHLFERNPFYSKCRYTLDTDGKSPGEICEEIIRNLPVVR